MRQRQALERSINAFQKLERDLDDAVTLIELGEAEKDEATVRRARPRCSKLAADARRQEVEALLSGEADGNDTYVEVHAGAGGTESQDWAEMLARMYMRWAEERGYKVSLVEAERGRGGRHQVGDPADQGRERLRLAQDRIGRAPAGAHLALRQQRAPPHQLCQRVGLSGGRRQHRDRHQGKRVPHRHLPRLGRRRPARQHHRLGGAHHPHPHQHRGGEPAGALADQEPLHRLGDAEIAPLRAGAEEARGEGQRGGRRQDRHRLGPPDPLLRAAALPAGEGPAHRHPEHRSARRCSTATSTTSSRRRWRTASRAGATRRWRISISRQFVRGGLDRCGQP